jgi:hypothetical protein
LIYEWLIPAGWTLNGQPSNGTTPIAAGKSVTIGYPANGNNGTIKVRGYHSVNGCSDGVQTSKWSDVINVKRVPTFKLEADKEWLFCGDTEPVNFTLTCTNMQLPCAVYYWNNSQTSTTENTFSYTPNGSDNFTVSVKVVYGSSEQTIPKTINYKVTNPDYSPFISGSGAICDNDTEYYSLANVPDYYNVNWSCTGAIQLVSGQGTTTAGFEKTGTGEATVEAKINTPCGSWPTRGNSVWDVWAGVPGEGLYPDNIIGPDCLAIGSTNNFFDGYPMPLKIEGAEWYNWVLSPSDPYINVFPYSDQASARVEVGSAASTGNYTLWVTAENQCGTSGNGWAGFEVQTESYCNNGFYMTMSPNPARDYVEINFTPEQETKHITGKTYLKLENEKKTDNDFCEYEIQIWSETQLKVLTVKSDQKNLYISTKDIFPGKYFLHLIINDNIHKQQLIIE